jgi:hypothetical protein
MNLQIPLKQFYLKSFIEKSQRDGSKIMTGPVFRVESPENFELEDLYEDQDEEVEIAMLYKYLVEDCGYVYVNFSSCYCDEREIECVDGNSYFYITEEDIEFWEDEDEDIPEDVQPVKGFTLSEDTSIGYLLQYIDDKLHIKSSMFYLNGSGFIGPCGVGSYSTIEPMDDVEIFNVPMKQYLEQFKVL